MSRFFHEMDLTLRRKAIEGHEDVLTDEAKKQEALYSSFSCPRCHHSPLFKSPHPKPFIDGYLLPRSLLKCPRCDHELDPHTGIDVKLGNIFKIPPDIPIIDPKGDE